MWVFKRTAKWPNQLNLRAVESYYADINNGALTYMEQESVETNLNFKFLDGCFVI